MSIKIVIDSASDIDQKEADSLGLSLIPMEISFGEDLYLDGVTITHKEFYNKLIEGDIIPRTSQINEFRFEEEFDRLTKDGDEVLCIVMSSKLSGTYNNAKMVSKKYNGKVEVVDSLSVAVGEKILLDLALRLTKENKPLKEIVDILNEKKNKIQVIALLNTLKYLEKGGRISKGAAIAGTLLNVKPVVGIIDGKVKQLGKALGSRQGNNMLTKLVDKSGGIDFSLPLATGYSGLSDILLKKYIEDSAHLWEGHIEEIPQRSIGSTIGTHIGPGAIALAFYSNN